MARGSNPDEIKRTVNQFASDAIGTHGRIAERAARFGGEIKDTAERGWRAAKDWWQDDGRGNTRRRHGDIRLPGRRNNRASGRR